MSRLIEKFHEAAKAAPMGFRAARPAAAGPKMLLIFSAEAGTVEKQTDDLTNADAILLRFTDTTLTAKALQKAAASLADLPWGMNPADDEAKKIETEGTDFVILTADGEVAEAPGDEKKGKILQVESSMDDGLLRAINDLPVDAALAADTFENDNPLSWHQLMIIQHLANLITKPLVVTAPGGISEKEIKALWDAGVDGILVEAEKAGAARLKEMRQAIDKLPPRTGRKRGKLSIVLPRASGEPSTPPPPPDEEEEEEE